MSLSNSMKYSLINSHSISLSNSLSHSPSNLLSHSPSNSLSHSLSISQSQNAIFYNILQSLSNTHEIFKKYYKLLTYLRGGLDRTSFRWTYEVEKGTTFGSDYVYMDVQMENTLTIRACELEREFASSRSNINDTFELRMKNTCKLKSLNDIIK